MTLIPPSTTILCPRCHYDVSRTLADGLETCPECGAYVDESVCTVDPNPLCWRQRLSILSPLLAGLAGAWIGLFAQGRLDAHWIIVAAPTTLFAVGGFCIIHRTAKNIALRTNPEEEAAWREMDTTLMAVFLYLFALPTMILVIALVIMGLTRI